MGYGVFFNTLLTLKVGIGVHPSPTSSPRAEDDYSQQDTAPDLPFYGLSRTRIFFVASDGTH